MTGSCTSPIGMTLVERLRFCSIDDDLLDAAKEAADEIERLRTIAREAAEAATQHQAEVLRLRAALAVYADPSFYHDCFFMFDRPTGGLDQDFSYDEDYGRDMPGKLARETLEKP